MTIQAIYRTPYASGFKWLTIGTDGDYSTWRFTDNLLRHLAAHNQTADLDESMDAGTCIIPTAPPPPLPELWVNVYADGRVACGHRSRLLAFGEQAGQRYALVHLIPDGGGYRCEVER